MVFFSALPLHKHGQKWTEFFPCKLRFTVRHFEFFFPLRTRHGMVFSGFLDRAVTDLQLLQHTGGKSGRCALFLDEHWKNLLKNNDDQPPVMKVTRATLPAPGGPQNTAANRHLSKRTSFPQLHNLKKELRTQMETLIYEYIFLLTARAHKAIEQKCHVIIHGDRGSLRRPDISRDDCVCMACQVKNHL